MFSFNKVGKISYVGEPGAAADESFSTSTGSFLNPFPLSFWKRKYQPCFGQWGESVWRMSPFSLTSSSLVTSHNLQGLPCTQAGWKHQGKCPHNSFWPVEFFNCIFRTASLSPNADRTRDFVGQGQTVEEKEEEARQAKEREERERKEKEEMEMPLQLATLPGKQEIVLKFTEMNQVNKVSYKKSVK